jgi:hypothetical protein
MSAPYRRIIVLHTTIIGSGFALQSMNEPLVGLLLLITIKTAFDLEKSNKDIKKLIKQKVKGELNITPEMHEKMQGRFPKPVVKINGKEINYKNFKALKESKHYRMMTAVMRLIGAAKDIKMMDTYMDMKIKEENSEANKQ